MNIAIIIQRYDQNFAGGAESEAYTYANILKETHDVSVLTTTAKESSSWRNYYPQGTQDENGIRIHRFNVDYTRTEEWRKLHDRFVKYYNSAVNVGKKEINFPVQLQNYWIKKQGPHSSELLDFIYNNRNRYDRYIYFSYLYSPTYYGSQITDSEKNIFVPTLHDEPPAYLTVFQDYKYRFKDYIWNSNSEKKLGSNIWSVNKGQVIGNYIKNSYLEIVDCKDPIIRGLYILYSGRLDAGKNLHILIDYYLRYTRTSNNSIKLVITGTGDMKIPKKKNILNMGFVSEEDKINLMANALAFVMPSELESLSIATLEAMALKIPVIVNEKSEVLRDHIKQSSGGFLYCSYETFEESINNLVIDSDLKKRIGIKGREYINQNYTYSIVKNKLLNIVEQSN